MRFLRATKVLLFLPVGFVATDTTYNRAAISRSLATSDTACASELDACNADDSCIECFNVFADSIDACQSSLSLSCDDVQDDYCCALAAEDEDCENSFTFGSLIECGFAEANPTCSAGDLDISDCIGGDTGGVTTDDEPTTGDLSSSADDTGDTDDTNGTDGIITTGAASRARSWGLSSVVSSTAVAGLLVAVFGAVV